MRRLPDPAHALQRPDRVAYLALPVLLAAGLALAADDALPVYSLEDIATHNGLASCWMAIDGQVYDVTGHIPTHPAQPEVVAPWCGRDATEGFRTKGYGQEHSPAARIMLDGYRIGTLAVPGT